MPDEVIPVPMSTVYSEKTELMNEAEKKIHELTDAILLMTAEHLSRGILITTIYRIAFFGQVIPIMAAIEHYAKTCNIELPKFLGEEKENRFDPKEVVNVVLTADAMQQDRAAIGADAKESTKRVLTKFTEG